MEPPQCSGTAHKTGLCVKKKTKTTAFSPTAFTKIDKRIAFTSHQAACTQTERQKERKRERGRVLLSQEGGGSLNAKVKVSYKRMSEGSLVK